MRTWNRYLQLHCHMINALNGIRTNKPWQRNDGSHIHHATNDKWRRLHTTITNTALYLMREDSILIVFTWTSWRFLHVYAGLLVNATMIALFACWRLEQNGNGKANADKNKSWLKSLIVSDYNRIQYYKLDPPKIGRAPITNVISNTNCTISIKPYWELMHQANPNIHCTLRLHLRLPATVVRHCPGVTNSLGSWKKHKYIYVTSLVLLQVGGPAQRLAPFFFGGRPNLSKPSTFRKKQTDG